MKLYNHLMYLIKCPSYKPYLTIGQYNKESILDERDKLNQEWIRAQIKTKFVCNAIYLDLFIVFIFNINKIFIRFILGSYGYITYVVSFFDLKNKSNATITIGGGESSALTLMNNLSKGVSKNYDTFGSPQLSKNQEFNCISLEVWGLCDYK